MDATVKRVRSNLIYQPVIYRATDSEAITSSFWTATLHTGFRRTAKPGWKSFIKSRWPRKKFTRRSYKMKQLSFTLAIRRLSTMVYGYFTRGATAWCICLMKPNLLKCAPTATFIKSLWKNGTHSKLKSRTYRLVRWPVGIGYNGYGTQFWRAAHCRL